MAQQKREDGRIFDTVTVIRDVLKDWWIALLAALMAAMLAYMMIGCFYRPQYTASTTLVVYTNLPTSTAPYTRWNTNKNAAKRLAHTLTSDSVRLAVTEAMGLTAFQGKISAGQVDETNLISLEVTTDTPITAYRALNALLESYRSVTDRSMPNVMLKVLKSTFVPASASNPINLPGTMALAALAGLLLAVGLEVSVSYFRDTVKNENHYADTIDAPLISTVYHENKRRLLSPMRNSKKTSILISRPGTSLGLAETMRIIRTKVEYMMGKSGGKVLMVSSTLENEGKSTVSANLALSLAQKGYRVILADCDMRKPAIYKIFDKHIPNDNPLRSLVKGTLALEDAPLYDAAYGLKLLLGRKMCADSTDLITSDGMKALISRLRNMADYVIFDTPPMNLFSDAECLAQLVDATLLVVGQHIAKVQDINESVNVLMASRAEFLGCVLNNVHTGVLLERLAQNSSYGYVSARKSYAARSAMTDRIHTEKEEKI